MFEGLFLLKSTTGSLFELTDDVYLGEENRLIFGLDLSNARLFLSRLTEGRNPDETYLYYEWNSKVGSGFVRNFMPGGKQILTCFSRFYDDNQKPLHGIFVGGGLPEGMEGDVEENMDETGMAFFDGKRWYHLWCNANEGIASGSSGEKVPPDRWKFLGSEVVNASGKTLSLKSSHEAVVDGVPLLIERSAFFRAGDPFFILSIRVTNTGKKPTSYYYCYGDEPWVGDFGRGAGNVGWVKDRVVDCAEWLDPARQPYAGIYDFGNDLIGEGHNFTGTANFIEWLGKNVPAVYFSNGPLDYPKPDSQKVPLKSDTRFIGLQWEPQLLLPGRSECHTLAIGMAGRNPNTGFPVKPNINLYGLVDPQAGWTNAGLSAPEGHSKTSR